MKKLFMGMALLLFMLMPLVSVQVANAEPGDLVLKMGAGYQLKYPSGVGVDGNGNVYVFGSTILKFDNSGNFLTSWESSGSNGGAVDSSGNVYAIDTYNNRIEKFDSTGKILAAWGSFGSGNGQFYNPMGVAVDKIGNVYVADSSNHRIQKFDSSGHFIASWGALGTGNGQFYSPSGVAADGNGNIYVADTSNNRIQKFDNAGKFLAAWGGIGSANGQFYSPSNLACDSSGNVYVIDNSRIQKFDSSGNFITTWGSYGDPKGFSYPSGVAVDPLGKVYVADSNDNNVRIFDSGGTYLDSWESPGSAPGEFNSPSAVAVDTNGNIYVVESDNHRLQKFDSNGAFLATWGSYGSLEGQFMYPSGVAIDASGNVYVADSGNYRIQKFDSQGNFITTWGGYGQGAGLFESLNDVAVDFNGNVYTAGFYDPVQKFSSTGTFLQLFEYVSNEPRAYMNPVGVAVDRSGNVYVSDFYNYRILKFDSAGNMTGRGVDLFWETPGSIAIDGSGNLYLVASDAQGRGAFVQVFDSAGALKGVLADVGGFLDSWNHFSIAVDALGTKVYVADSLRNSVAGFEGYGSPISQSIGINCGGPAFTDSTGQAFGGDAFYTGGYTNSTTLAIPGTVDDKLFQSWRYGNISYNIPLNNGNYSVTMKFSDWYSAVGKRIFDVKLEGVTVLSNFDIFARAGYLNPYDVVLPVTVTDGVLNIQFINKIDNAKINAILIKPAAATINYTISASAGTGGSISPTGSVSVSAGNHQSFTITPNTGYTINDLKVDGVSVGAPTSYSFTNVTANHAIQASFAAVTASAAAAINCGGPAFTDSNGQLFVADSYYSGGYTNSTTLAIPGTVDDKLYQGWRYGNLNYNIPVSNGSYSVTLKFSDWYSAAGKRVFDVKMEGTTVLSNFDIFAKAGYLNAYDVTIPVTVSDGTLNIQFINKVDNAKINAIIVKFANNNPLPAPWLTQDIGSVGFTGNAGYLNNTFTLTGSGADIWGTSDSFRFVYQPLTGDGQIIARVSSLQNTNAWAKSGVMIRETLAANSAHALVDIMQASGSEFARRLSAGATTSTSTLSNIAVPYWVRLIRSGNVFSGYVSADGLTWFPSGTATINMSSSVYIGLAVTSHDNKLLCTAKLDGVSVTKGNSNFTISASAGISGTISPSGAVSVPSGTSQSFQITPNTGYSVANVKVDGVSVGPLTDYVFSNVTADHTIEVSFVANIAKTVAAVNCGGPAFTDSTGQFFTADTYYSGGYTNSTTSAIPNTVEDKLYQNWRYGNVTYNIPVANGNYNVILKFSDWYSTVGKRVFDVKMEGTTVLSNFDIVAKAGYLNAYDVTTPVTVTDGTLNIQFINKVDNAKINAIVVKTR